MDTQFKVGDKVTRLPEYPHGTLGLPGTVHTVKGYDGNWLVLEGISGGWYPQYFKLANVDAVNSPPHYNSGQVETIDYILQVTKNYPGNEAALVANVIKYVSRAPLKGDKGKDLKKAQWYMNKLVEVL